MTDKQDNLPQDYFTSMGPEYLRELLQGLIDESARFNHNAAAVRSTYKDIDTVLFHLEKHGTPELVDIANEYKFKLIKN